MADRERDRPRIRPAAASEAALISSLAIRSKAHWGYGEDRMRVFRDELTLTPDEVVAGDAHVAEVEGVVRGFYTLTRIAAETVELEHLFVDPDVLRGGLGRTLLEHAVDRARGRGFSRMTVQSDPNAEGFYAAAGFRKLRDLPTSIPGRTLPEMERTLA